VWESATLLAFQGRGVHCVIDAHFVLVGAGLVALLLLRGTARGAVR